MAELDQVKNKDILEMINQNDENLKKLHDIVRKSFEEEKLIVDNLINPTDDYLNRGQLISDKVARFGGSWSFILIFTGILIVWILYNTLMLKQDRFDPYPFILMNLVLSCLAALQAPIIMMSQNRQEEKDRKRAENDYLVNLKAELEIRSLHKKIDVLLEEEVKQLFDSQVNHLKLLKQLSEHVDRLEKELKTRNNQQ
ncbi:hypothetical protein SMI01S_25370 [Sphingobacterium mizutaii NBRC 14946 = DSM 11724]|uniref:Predicted membrane protein n=2 Tax=Sphingobacterium mizutaii TaxID=1010 RepID=A0AAJ4XBY1_9SPHI|nr:DUF1003 domain-containing protein [Sphingobacterium mizutaii]GEM68931.1 hypothetical protein SMI01S_25370 [Sphingobacterium mizutaii NBRC 14946 = DSM 11724]SDL02894.1 Uncharacterized membrane protein [Sphingobacterium mizutaii]SNV50381.1 Predicted membrane protein [Sphingobacterium mizutaii]